MQQTTEYKLDTDASVRVTQVMQEHRNWVEAENASGNRDRLEKNAKFYSGVMKQQWNDASLKMLNEQGRPAHTINVTQRLVRDILGELEQNPFETSFVANKKNKIDAVDTVKKLYDYDFERGNWEFEKAKFKRDMLIHTGVSKMFIDYRHDKKFGNVGLRALNPQFVWVDPYWQTDDVMDCRGVFVHSWMTAAQILRDFKKNNDQIRAAIDFSNFNSTQIEVVQKAADRSPEWFDSRTNQYKVLEFTYTENVRKRRAFDTETADFIEDFDGDAFDPLDDQTFQNALFSQGNRLKMVKDEQTIVKAISIAPALGRDLVLSEGLYDIQMGRLPFVFGSYENLHGERQGLVDSLVDLQEMINKRESTISHILGTTGNNNWLVEAGAFGNDGAELDRFKRDVSKGGQVFDVEDGTNREGKIKPLDRPTVPSDLPNYTDRAEVRMNTMAGMTPSQKGLSQGANESEVLFSSKRDAARAQLELLNKSLKRVDQEIGEMYFYAMKTVYGKAERSFTNGKTGENIHVNQFGIDERGELQVVNDISQLARPEVMIAEAPMGRTKKNEYLAKNIELLRVVSNPIARAMLEKSMFRYMDLPEDELKKLEESSDLFNEFQFKQVQLQVAQIDSQLPQNQAPTPTNAVEVGNDATQISKLPGLSNLPNNAGVAGGESATNNSANASPSDFANR